MQIRYFLLSVVLGLASCFIPQYNGHAKSWQEIAVCADSLFKAKQTKEAIELAEQALSIAVADPSAGDTAAASIMYRLGVYCNRDQDNSGAEKYFRMACDLRIKAFGADDLDAAKCRFNLGVVYKTEGRYDSATAAYSSALSIRERRLGTNDALLIPVLSNMGSLLGEMGDYRTAEALFTRAIAIDSLTNPGNPLKNIRIRNELALLYWRQGRLQAAERVFRYAVAVQEQAQDKNQAAVVAALNNLGSLYYDYYRYTDADSLFTKSLRILESAETVDSLWIAVILGNIGKIAMRCDSMERAEACFMRALSLYREIKNTTALDSAKALINLGEFYDNLGRYTEAEALLQRAFFAQTSICGSFHPRLAATRSSLALLYRHMQNWERAKTLEREAFSIRYNNMWDFSLVLPESKALQYSRWMRREAGNYLSILLDDPNSTQADIDAIADVVIASKGPVSDHVFIRQQETLLSTDRQLQSLADSLRNLRFELSKLYVSQPQADAIKTHRSRIEHALRRKESLESMIAELGSATYRNDAGQEINVTDIQRSLPQHSVLIEYLKFEKRVDNYRSSSCFLAVVIPQKGNTQVFQLGKAASIDSLIKAYCSIVKHPALTEATDYNRISKILYEKIWHPFAAFLEGESTVFISPDGDLNLISFTGLLDYKNEYLIEKYPIHYLSASRDLVRFRDLAPSGSGLFAMGDPDFDAFLERGDDNSISRREIFTGLLPKSHSQHNVRSGCVALEDLTVLPLPGTRQEVNMVSEQWGINGAESSQIYFGSDATEENFKRFAPGKQVIYLATHGYYISKMCHSERVADDVESLGDEYIGENPLLLSGFLLAGARRHGEWADDSDREDGIVTAEEVAGMKLQGTDLVVLSACKTGLGEVKSGEGVYGLQRAFLMAGARTIVGTLWAVDDKSTADFMGQLFSRNDETVPQTMQRIALNRISDLRAEGKPINPILWAGFAATGDWRSR